MRTIPPKPGPVKPFSVRGRASPEEAEIAVRTFIEQRAREEAEMRARMLDEAETSERLAEGWRW